MWEQLLLILVIIVAVIVVIAKINNERSKSRLLKLLNEAGGINYKYRLISTDFKINKPFAIAIDDSAKKVVIVQDQVYKYEFKDIRDAEVVVDESEVINKSTLNTLGRAAIGGILLGGIGMLAGAVSGKSKVNNKIKKLDLKIKVNSLDTSAIVLNFFDSKIDTFGGNDGVRADNEIYKKAVKYLDDWFERFKVITELNQR